ncbi:LTA synthase family protein [Pseudorhodoplanes sp.]|uniref:LTA synthase family protein n=1 Tax=Pseudorhodoplanes sp. TaxID=1934341 RepID=UPI002CA37735|nr:LTA synthase family protein [Pseudorhodoplanes sp.]HWV54062.1 LTA synthase family protein [Pseudorhodoplanes sp.]
MSVSLKPVRLALTSWLERFWPAIALFLVAQTLVRLALALLSGSGFVDHPIDIVRPFVIGLWFDLAVLLAVLIPGTLYWVLLPRSWHGGRFDRAMMFSGFALFVFIVGFTMIGEVLFWNEFGARFNFIAVDYLVYTREVVGNIRESYPVGRMLAALVAVAVLLTILLRRVLRADSRTVALRSRAAVFVSLVMAAVLVNDASKSSWTEVSSNNYANEISANGYYTLVRAFFGNEIDYRRFYALDDEARVNRRIRDLVASPNARFVSTVPGDITRDIVDANPVHMNVVLVTIESLSASFMDHFGNRLGLTPNLDALADQSLFFANMLATGTRTVRGLEAVTLSVPPTPGQSILRRPGNERLFSLGSVMRDHGYSTTYLYGGDGDFDNMNVFFSSNGYRIVDRRNFAPSEVRFSNAWGVCDEDLFSRALREADASFATGKPFFQHVMTVSNHRPYTYPTGRISPPHGNTGLQGRTLASYIEQTREGGVKYTDYAIGTFLEQARSRPWFKDTLFVFVADHTASAAGKIEVDPSGYHIPAMFYAPAMIAPRRVDRLVSQIDIAPTILGLLHMTYRSRFVGQDQSGPNGPERAFISNYQKVGLIRQEGLALLGPRHDVTGFRDGHAVRGAEIDDRLRSDAIAFYQHASRWQQHFAGTNSVIPGGPGD